VKLIRQTDAMQHMRQWGAHFPVNGTSTGTTNEVHTTPADLYRGCVSFASPPSTTPSLLTSYSSGMIGQYPLSPLVGKLVDYYGPWLCSLIASVLFSSAFSLLSWEFSNTPDDIEVASPTSFRRLVVYFAMAGSATAFS
jgi:hypothetical protein